MTAGELISLLSFVLDDSDIALDASGRIPSTYVALFNACSDNLTEVARYKKQATVDYLVSQGVTEISLPADCLSLPKSGALWFKPDTSDEYVEVARVLLTDTSTTGFRQWGDKLILQPPPTEDGKYLIYYYATLPRFTGDPGEEPVIPAPFHELYVLFAAARYMQTYQSSEDLQVKRDFRGEYDQLRAELDVFTAMHDTAPYPVMIDTLYHAGSGESEG